MRRDSYYFKPREGSSLSAEKAERYGSYIYAIGKRRKRGIRPDELVALAEAPDNPCHDAFTWDDGAAAREFRLIEARTLLRSIVVVYGENGEGIEDIAFHRVPVAGRKKDEVAHAYVPVEQIVNKPEDLAYVCAEYERRIRRIARDLKRHRAFSEAFGGVVDRLEDAVKEMAAVAAAD